MEHRPEQGRDDALFAGRYRLEEQLGEGGVGSVHRAHDEGGGRTVALKVLLAPTKQSRALFQREFETLAKLAHPSVIQVFEYGEVARTPYYTMELLEGKDLLSVGTLPWAEVCSGVRDVATSLALLHSQRLVHRDVSPRNVRLSAEGHAKLLDFGALASFGIPGEQVGTPSCIAPEAVRRHVVDARTDLFSLGVVAYWSLTGRLPYAVRSFESADEAWCVAPLPPSQHVASIPRGLDELLLSMLSIDPNGRPSTAAEVIDRLGALATLDEEHLWSLAESHVHSADVVGRAREQARMRDALQAASEGHGTMLTFVGDAGTGKTRLLHELSIRGQLAGFAVVPIAVAADCSPQALVVSLVHGLQQHVPAETRAARALQSQTLRALLGTGARRPAHFEHERTLRMQLELGRLVTEIARKRALLITLDGVESLSATAAALLPILAQCTVGEALLIGVARRSGPVVPAVELLSSVSEVISLGELDEAALEALTQSIFGDAPNRTRLTRWLSTASRGNPGRVRRVLVDLLKRRVVRYGGGAWLLPFDFAGVELPDDGQDDHGASISGSARELLRALACHRGALPERACEKLVDGAGPALRELVEKRFVARGPDGVTLVQAGLARSVLARLHPDEARAIHERLAEVLLELLPGLLAQFRAGRVASLPLSDVVLGISLGLHLLISGRESEADRLLGNGAIDLTVRGEGLNEATAALEAAVEVSRSRGRPMRSYARMLPALSLAGTYSDWRLSYRYAEDTLRLLTRSLGFHHAQRLAPWLGRRLALYLALAGAYLFHVLVPARRLAPDLKTAILGVIGVGAGALSVCASMMDAERVKALGKLLAPLRYFPPGHPAREVAESQLALRDHTMGRYAESRQRVLTLLRYLRGERARRDLVERARVQLEAGMLVMLAQLDAGRADDCFARTPRSTACPPPRLHTPMPPV